MLSPAHRIVHRSGQDSRSSSCGGDTLQTPIDFSTPMIRTNQSPPSGTATGRVTLSRPVLDSTLTNRTASGRDGSSPKGFSVSNRIRSLPLQNAISALNGSFRRSSAMNFARDPGFRTTSPGVRPGWIRAMVSLLDRNSRSQRCNRTSHPEISLLGRVTDHGCHGRCHSREHSDSPPATFGPPHRRIDDTRSRACVAAAPSYTPVSNPDYRGPNSRAWAELNTRAIAVY